jgi:hypothetical protein
MNPTFELEVINSFWGVYGVRESGYEKKLKKVKKPPCAVCEVFDILCTRSPERVTLIFEKRCLREQ